jgi:hypothetical protein
MLIKLYVRSSGRKYGSSRSLKMSSSASTLNRSPLPFSIRLPKHAASSQALGPSVPV